MTPAMCTGGTGCNYASLKSIKLSYTLKRTAEEAYFLSQALGDGKKGPKAVEDLLMLSVNFGVHIWARISFQSRQRISSCGS